ncbi:ABC transporter ATP-binding protein [Ochrobactrum sp. CM-21-5]|nr:ABC transporter ATP-binding protein [Ochrobactrum sp. CM-21-5]MBC2886578.1 ABC transporter ATP-binding protein [Ochrobactrum sp. CM-21-5]
MDKRNSLPDSGLGISIKGVTKKYGNFTAVDGLDMEIAPGEFLALLGPSGSGKSTILMMLAGFEQPDKGRVLFGSHDYTRVPPHKRNIGMVFQHYTLFPNMSVLDNVAFPLKTRGMERSQRHRVAREALDRVKLADFAGRSPKQLSGGQQQRVALARAIVYSPHVLLMDEPLSALDKNLREEMQIEIKRLHTELGMTIVFVTHDQGEALTMANRVAILQSGHIQQIAGARELYNRPANLFSAGFIGEMNLIPIVWDGRMARAADGTTVPIPSENIMNAPSGEALLAIRPERLAPSQQGLEITVRDVIYAGPDTAILGAMADGTELRARLASAALPDVRSGQKLRLGFAPEAGLIYRRAG